MNNFKRLKNCENEYEMADIICGYFCNNAHILIKENGEFNQLEVLNWLKSNKDIFGNERTTN
ncbi:MAG: hypothetical protein ACI4ES_12245 [Roseburia sp.]